MRGEGAGGPGVSLPRVRVSPSILPLWVRLWGLDACWLSLEKQTLTAAAEAFQHLALRPWA